MEYIQLIVIVISIILPYNNVYEETLYRPENYDFENKELSLYFQNLGDTKTQVKELLNIIKKIYPNWRDNYELNKFDCTEMSEFVSYFFTKAGIKNYYKQSDGIWHAWIEVPLEDGSKLLIEATNLSIIPEKNWEYYYQYNDVKTNPRMYHNEIDWWKSEFFYKELEKVPYKVMKELY